MVGVLVLVGGGMVTTVLVVGGTDVDEVGGGNAVVVGASVVVVSGGGEVGCTGGEVVATVPAGRVVTTGGCVVTDPPDDGMVAGVVVVDSTMGDDVEVDDEEVDGRVAGAELLVGRTVVAGDWVATCCLADVSPPVATSNRSATRATEARA